MSAQLTNITNVNCSLEAKVKLGGNILALCRIDLDDLSNYSAKTMVVRYANAQFTAE